MRRPETTRPRRHRGELSAGRVLVVMVVGFVVAALVNADAMVERAEEKPFGGARDRSLAVWHPVQDVAHVLQLHRIRGGEEDQQDFTPTTQPEDELAAAVRPEVRSPTAAAPLRVLLAGDSVIRDFGESVLRLSADDPRYDTALHYEIATGLTRDDVFNWPAALAADLEAGDPEVVVVMFGGNDGQGIVEPDGTVHQRVTDPGWAPEYARRVGLMMDQLQADDRLVYWVLQPPMRDAEFDERIDIINDVFVTEAEDRPWVEIVETAPLFGDGNGDFVDLVPGAGGGLEDLRQDDGIHLARAGADLLAANLLQLLAAEISPEAD
jgi:uncharacterized protein